MTLENEPTDEKMKTVDQNEEACKKNSSLYVLYLKQKRPDPGTIRKLHPKIIDVRLPRSKSARFCIIEFENPEAARSAKNDLQSNSDISVRLRRQEKKTDPEKIKKKQEKILKRKLQRAEKLGEGEPPRKQGRFSKNTQDEKSVKLNRKSKTINEESSKNFIKITEKSSTKKQLKRPLLKNSKANPKNTSKRAPAKRPSSSERTSESSASNEKDDLPGGDACWNEELVANFLSNLQSSLMVKGLPLLASQEVLQNIFPQAVEIHLSNMKSKGKRCGLVRFENEEESTAALESSIGVSVNGRILEIAKMS